MGIRIKVEGARVSFADGLNTASAFEQGQTPKFGADFILVEGHKLKKKVDGRWTPVKSIQDVMVEVATETWKTKEAGMAKLKELSPERKSVRRGDARTDKSGNVYDGYEGCLYITAKSKTRPTLYGADGMPLADEQRPSIYSGCYVTALIDIYGIADRKRQGVFAGLVGVQFMRDGDAFAGGAPVEDGDFEDLSADAGEMGGLEVGSEAEEESLI